MKKKWMKEGANKERTDWRNVDEKEEEDVVRGVKKCKCREREREREGEGEGQRGERCEIKEEVLKKKLKNEWKL